jgi:hypothetical protein
MQPKASILSFIQQPWRVARDSRKGVSPFYLRRNPIYRGLIHAADPGLAPLPKLTDYFVTWVGD